MNWNVEKEFEAHSPDGGVSGLPAMVLMVLLVPLLLAFAALVGVALAVAGVYRLGRRWWGQEEPVPEPEPPAPVRVLDTPGLVVDLIDWDAAALSPDLQALLDAWAEVVAEEHELGSVVVTTPELPGLHGQLVAAFSHRWGSGLLLQLLEPAAGEPPVTSSLVFVDPAGPSWEKVTDVGAFQLYLPQDGPENQLEGWNQEVGKLTLRLSAAAPPASMV